MNLKKKQVNKLLTALTLVAVCFGPGSVNLAQAADTPPPPPNDGPEAGSSMTTVRPQIGSTQPSNLNLQQLPNLLDMPQTPETIEKELKMEEDGEKLFKQHLLDKALAKWQDAYGLSLEMKYAEGEGRALTNMGRVFLERGQYIKAKYMGENAIEVLNGVSDKKALGRAHLYLAQAYFGLDNPVWAGQQLDYAMKTFTADGGNNAADTAKLMSIAASIILKAGKLKEALQFLQASATYYEQAGDNANAIASRINVVNVLLSLGLYTAAQEEVDKALTVARSAPDQLANMAAALSCLANCKFSFGEYSQAKKIYVQVLAYAKKIPPEQLTTVGKANMYLGYGTTLAALHDYNKAKQALEFALPVFKASGSSLPQAEVSNTLGLVEWHLGHQEKAKELLQQALDLHNLIVPKQDYFRNTVLQNLATIESRMGANREAKSHLEAVAAQQKKSKNNTNLGHTYLSLAETMIKLVESGEAEHWLTQAIESSQSVSDDASLWREYTLLAKIQLGQANTKAAHESLLSATSFLRSPQAGDFSSPEKLYFLSDRRDMAYQLIQLLVQEHLVDEALLVSEQLKQEAFLANWADCDVQVRGNDVEVYTDLVAQRAHLHAAEMVTPPNKVTKEWQNWLTRFHTLCSENKHLARLIAPIQTNSADMAKIIQAHHSTVVDYVLGKESAVVFVLTPNGKVAASTLNIGSKQLIGKINSLLSNFAHEANENEGLLSDRLLRTLYSDLFPESVRALLPHNPEEQLVIIPDGPLDSLPFAALMDTQGKYLISHHVLNLAPSLTALIDNPSIADNPGFVLVAGTNKEDDDVEQLKTIAQALPSSAVTLLKGSDASLRNVQDQAIGKTAIQIAGKFNLLSAPNGLATDLPLKQSKEDTATSIATVLATPMACDAVVLSGSAVAKNEDQDRNSMYPVSSAACALRYAGVRNGVIDLWHQESNNRTEELIDFYKKQLSGESAVIALRQAELAQLSRNVRPINWASFQIFGPLY